LAKKQPLAAAKLYWALGLRILNAGKTKYYDAALDHLEKSHDLYCGAGQASEWEALVRSVRAAHSRKSGFLSAFEQLASGKTQRFPSFADQAQEGWTRLIQALDNSGADDFGCGHKAQIRPTLHILHQVLKGFFQEVLRALVRSHVTPGVGSRPSVQIVQVDARDSIVSIFRNVLDGGRGHELGRELPRFGAQLCVFVEQPMQNGHCFLGAEPFQETVSIRFG
jgi:hypothetical protein